MLAKLESSRELRGESIAVNGLIERVAENQFMVHSQTSSKEYTVGVNGQSWTCSCPDHQYRHVECKHIHAVEDLLAGSVE
jgi:membrane protein implicated in regulation of membrane protease activity